MESRTPNIYSPHLYWCRPRANFWSPISLLFVFDWFVLHHYRTLVCSGFEPHNLCMTTTGATAARSYLLRLTEQYKLCALTFLVLNLLDTVTYTANEDLKNKDLHDL